MSETTKMILPKPLIGHCWHECLSKPEHRLDIDGLDMTPESWVQMSEIRQVERPCAVHQHIASTILRDHLRSGLSGGLLGRQIAVDAARPVDDSGSVAILNEAG